jgi:hypothetical protein
MDEAKIRFCRNCDARLSNNNPGHLCFSCQKKIVETIDTDSECYDVRDMMLILGLTSEEQVRRLGRAGIIQGKIPGIKEHRYVKEVVDDWIKYGGSIVSPVVDPLLKAAFELCRKGDHSFFTDQRLDGHAYITETVSSGTTYVITVSYKKTCHFCGCSEIFPL